MAEKRESNIKTGHVNYKCLDCGQITKRYLTKEEYHEVMECPNCEGKSVDLYKIAKYRTDSKPTNSLKVKIDVDCTEALKGLKAITREAKRATAALKELEQQKKYKYAELNDITFTVKGSSMHNTNAKEFLKQIMNENKRTGFKC